MLELNDLRKVSFSSTGHGTCQFFPQFVFTKYILTCLYYQNPNDGSKISDREVRKNTHTEGKGHCKDKISVSKRIHIFSCTAMIAKHLTQTFTLTCCQLTLIYCPYFSIMFTIRSMILKSTLY